MSHLDEIRLMVKVARMYYDQGIRQQEITERLNIHQSTISRLLKRAREAGIVRITVTTPAGVYSALEDALQARFQLKEAIVLDANDEEERMSRDLGAAAAFFLETSVKKGMIVGISSWSRSLLAMVDVMNRTDCGKDGKVVQILGGVGNASTQYYATQLAQRLAANIGASPVLLQAPGLVGSAEARRVLSNDLAVREAADYFDKVDIALVGIGSLEPSKLLASSGNTFSPDERAELRQLGAVGDICLRFIDAAGKPVRSPLMQRVIGIELNSLKRASRVVGIASGSRKVAAIHAALRGQWINVLITDRATAEELLAVDHRRVPADTAEERTPARRTGRAAADR
ncbi:MAG: sugar-binding transcriptional regulator [Acidobacteriota bacterium]|nr:sugar-binding transcriptional regulator [Acidobacteriota bacterium]